MISMTGRPALPLTNVSNMLCCDVGLAHLTSAPSKCLLASIRTINRDAWLQAKSKKKILKESARNSNTCRPDLLHSIIHYSFIPSWGAAPVQLDYRPICFLNTNKTKISIPTSTMIQTSIQH